MANLFDPIYIAGRHDLRMSVEFDDGLFLSTVDGFWVPGLVPDGPSTVRLEGEARNMGDFLECLEAFVQECREAMAKGGSDDEHE